MPTLILASTSPTRREMLARAGVMVDTAAPRVDEAMVRASMAAEGAPPRDVADLLAELKALKIAERRPEAVVIGADQVLDLDGRSLGKPETRAEARAQIAELLGRTHRLHSAVVVCEGGRPVWRAVSTARMTMRIPSPEWIEGYLDRNWESLRGSVGGYRVEEEGVRLFSRIEGDHFTILGLPLVDLLGYLSLRGFIPG